MSSPTPAYLQSLWKGRIPKLRIRLMQVAQEEADAAQVSVDDVLGASPKRAATAARIRTVVRMLEEPQCNKSALARIWGCERRTIQRLVARDDRHTPTPAA